MWLARFVVIAVLLAFQAPSADLVRSKLEAAVKECPDGTDFAETAGYRELVAALIDFKPADVAAQQPAPIDIARILADPASMRGAWVRATGYAIGELAIPLQTPIGSVKKVDRIVLHTSDSRIVCDLIGSPPPFKSQTDTVQVAGVFFRTVSYQTDKGLLTLPYVLARSMELVDTPSSKLGRSLLHGGPQLYAGILLGVLGVVVLVLYLRHTARDET